MGDANTLLGGLTSREFLDRYWQKRPLFVRGALPSFESPLAPEDLAGLACREDLQSRIVLADGGDYPWEARYGPFTEEDFAGLPDRDWTLLVQEVDRVEPAVASLLDRFRFFPNWRIDDVMISYAPPGGTVGAHVDNYDVFLVQGSGRRRWSIGNTPVEPVEEEILVPDVDIRMLANFRPDTSWELEPGDLLYLPPRLAHEGVALESSMTLSVGFRAPDARELAASFLTDRLESEAPARRYADPDLAVPAEPGEIDTDVLDRVRALLVETLDDRDGLADWFGRFATEPRREAAEAPPDTVATTETLIEALRGGSELRRSAPPRFAFTRRTDGTASLHVAGVTYALDGALAFAGPLLTGREPLTHESLSEALGRRELADLLVDLVNRGFLIVET